MGKLSSISWTTSTWNPWRGCWDVSPACDNCYAWASSKRNPKVLGVWGGEDTGGTRVVASEAVWGDPLKWNKAPERPRHFVFTASIADVFEQWDGPMIDHKGIVRSNIPNANQDHSHWAIWDGDPATRLTMDDCRLRMFDTIRRTPNLTYLLLTKRIEHVMMTLARCAAKSIKYGSPAGDVTDWLLDWVANGSPPANVWIGCTAENQEWADRRVPELLKVPAVRRFVSYEPALGSVHWRQPWLPQYRCNSCYFDGGPDNSKFRREGGRVLCPRCNAVAGRYERPSIDWLIVGGESGPHARPFDLAWARSARDQCRAAGTAFFMKQLGYRPVEIEPSGIAPGSIPDVVMDYHLAMGGSEPDDIVHKLKLADKHGADPGEWPSDLRVQEHPE